MTFTTITFLFTFLPIAFILYYICPKVYQNHAMLLISICFYAWGEPIYVCLLIGMLFINYYMVDSIAKSIGKKRKIHLIETLILNLFLLGYFKYYSALFGLVDVEGVFSFLPMPLGISFFTFSMISYIVDVYRKTTTQASTISSFALYVCFFPKLIMGPIEPYHVFEKKLFKHEMTINLLDQGAKYFVIGMAQKIILADTFARCYTNLQSIEMTFLSSWLMALAFTFQIYFDFSGYSHMALGLANMFGFPLMKNFKFPYHADSITSFWRRWHISLSQFFRDYVYIPLGGNRVSTMRHVCNLLIVWLLTGLWHGASLNFILWGLYYGVLLLIEKYVWKDHFYTLPKWLRWIYTFFFVNIGWVIFAHHDITSMITQLQAMFMVNTTFLNQACLFYLQNYFVFFLIAFAVSQPYLFKAFDTLEKQKPKVGILRFVMYAVVFVLSIFYIASSNFQSFLYFQF